MHSFIGSLKSTVRRVLPAPVIRRASAAKRAVPLSLLRKLCARSRTSPISTQFGWDRGTPVDRYYIDRFLASKAAYIRGRVLEVGDNQYTLHYGGERVARSDVLHVDASNSRATVVGDLARSNVLPEAAFDCIICTQTLQFIFDMPAAVRQLGRGLKPGGTLLLTVPGITQIPDEAWVKYWAFTPASTLRLLEENFGSGSLEVEFHGNVFAATAFLYGVACEELNRADLDVRDPSYPIMVTAFAVKRT